MEKIKIISMSILMLLSVPCCAQITDSMRFEQRLADVERQNMNLRYKIEVLEKLCDENKETTILLEKAMKQQDIDLQTRVDSIDRQHGNRIEQTDSTVQANETKQQHAVLWGIIVAAVLAVASVVAWVLLRKRINKKDDDIELLRARADELNQQMVEHMDKELAELQTIATNIKNSQQPSATQQPSTSDTQAEPDHSLVKALADRITFMEMTLYRMDSSVKGHKHLTKSIKQMKDNLLANGYELVDMLGKEYVEGMKVTASFIVDDSLSAGNQIITGIQKPQINYKGKMIQSAQITVSQNI